MTHNNIRFNEINEIVGPKPAVRYIKLGKNNAWADRALKSGEIPFSVKEVPHALALSGDEDRIAAHLIGLGKAQGAARNAARQVCTFYGLDETAIWITFADGYMWWTQATHEVIWLGESSDYAPRIRRSLHGWANATRFDVAFYMSGMSSRLTRLAGTQQTLCKVEADDYALRKIFHREEPAVIVARQVRETMLEAIVTMIANLDWADFETLIDLLLARGGWSRISGLGGNHKDADIVAEQAITVEKVFVQVKSTAGQKELDRYMDIFQKSGEWHRMIFACHSPQGKLVTTRPEVMVWSQRELAAMVFKNGLFDWLMDKAA